MIRAWNGFWSELLGLSFDGMNHIYEGREEANILARESFNLEFYLVIPFVCTIDVFFKHLVVEAGGLEHETRVTIWHTQCHLGRRPLAIDGFLTWENILYFDLRGVYSKRLGTLGLVEKFFLEHVYLISWSFLNVHVGKINLIAFCIVFLLCYFGVIL